MAGWLASGRCSRLWPPLSATATSGGWSWHGALPIAAEWAHFVAFGVFAYEQGGASGVGVAGLVRLLPAALVAPFAASFGDRFPRERFLLVMTLLSSAALAGSAVAFYADL